ncbi:MAG: phenylalanine--tRNA ligase subunit beta [Candidatus Omnitrophica bacterium]|nr:phenylalanine--tRNA ligase subunit beta [Candidatus Omnitrophota bacterium]
MKVSLDWLSKYVPFSVSPDELAHKLTMAGFEVEKIVSHRGDTVIELEITPNRPDCLNMLGLARETSAILGKKRVFPKIVSINFPKQKCIVDIEDKKGCPRYIATLVENPEIKASAEELAAPLENIHSRLVNNIVDITNFCMFETGQPMHAFDYDKLEGGKIIVRRANPGEKIITIDGVERKLDPSILVVADERKPVAIAGIMGGKDTEVTQSTKKVLLESAYFDPVTIRTASRKLGLSTDSSYRFERGVDFDMVEKGATRALNLITKLARGRITARKDENLISGKKEKKSVQVSISKINSYLNEKLTAEKCKGMLNALDFKSTILGKNKISVIPPSFRGDIKREEDIVEEIARLIGYDNLPITIPLIRASEVPDDETRKKRKAIKTALLAQGLDEIINYSMVSRANLAKAGQDIASGIRIRNPLTSEQELMRGSLLPGILGTVLTNINRQQKSLRFFEAGKIYCEGSETEALGLVIAGEPTFDWRKEKADAVDLFDLKGVVENTLQRALGLNVETQKGKAPYFRKEGSFVFSVDGKEVGEGGLISSEVLEKWDIKNTKVLFAQIDLHRVFGFALKEKRFILLCEYPAVTRDVSLAVKLGITFDEIKKAIFDLGGGILREIRFVEEYRGEKIPIGFRGIVFSLVYQSDCKTLTDDEVSALHGKIVTSIVDNFSAVQR